MRGFLLAIETALRYYPHRVVESMVRQQTTGVTMDAHKEAIEAIWAAYGSVLKDKTLPEHPIIEVDLGRSAATDELLQHLINLKSFKNLHVDKTAVSDKIM